MTYHILYDIENGITIRATTMDIATTIKLNFPNVRYLAQFDGYDMRQKSHESFKNMTAKKYLSLYLKK